MSGRIFPVIALLLLLLVTLCACSNSPIVIVPGILSSKIRAKLDKPSTVNFYCLKKWKWFTLWLSYELILSFLDSCFVDNAKLIYNNETGQYQNNYGVETEIPDGIDGIAYLDDDGLIPYLHEMIHYLSKHGGYIPGKDIRGAPYDWRHGVGQLKNDYFKNLQNLIQETYSTNEQAPVTIIAHSLGGHIIHQFLAHYVSQQWKEMYVKQFVSLSGVFGGTVKALQALISGSLENIPYGNVTLFRDLGRTLPSLMSLVPHTLLWNGSETLVTTTTSAYTVNDIHKLFKDIGYDNGTRMYAEVQGIINDYTAPNVTHHCFYGSEVSTVESLMYDKELTEKDSTTGNGDGTVNLRSLKACQQWGEQPQGVYLKEFSGIEHVKMVTDHRVLEAIKDLVVN